MNLLKKNTENCCYLLKIDNIQLEKINKKFFFKFKEEKMLRGKGISNDFYIQFKLMRHGEARPRHETNTEKEFVEDELNREITDLGKTQIQKVRNFDLIIASPARRAWETAELSTGINHSHFHIANSLSTHKWEGKEEGDWKLVEQVFVYPGDKRSLSEAYAVATTKQRQACDAITRNAFWKVVEIIKKQKLHNGYKVLIVGHSLHLQALGMALRKSYYNPFFSGGIEKIVLGLGEIINITSVNL